MPGSIELLPNRIVTNRLHSKRLRRTQVAFLGEAIAIHMINRNVNTFHSVLETPFESGDPWEPGTGVRNSCDMTKRSKLADLLA